MKIFENIFVIESFPALYIQDIDAVVIADLHLGYELLSSEHGVFVPRVQFKKSMEMIKHILEKQKTSRIIIVGDLKHEFSETSYHEYKEVSVFLEELLKHFNEVVVVKGNHDTFITRITRRYNIEVYDEFEDGNYLFVHGHKPKDFDTVKNSTVILGHEHPSIALFTDVGTKEKVKCFLHGKFKGKQLIVLPAFSYFAQGSDVNLIPKEELLSPILKKIDVDEMKGVGVLEGDQLLEFPSIGKLRRIYE